MKDAVDILKTRQREIQTELTRIDRALAALEPEKVAPRPPTSEETRQKISEGLKRRAALRKAGDAQTGA
jgi:hypothetical protein